MEETSSVGEAFCNHDAVAVINGICECGALVCEHQSTDVKETFDGAHAYVVCGDCGAELSGPMPGSGVL